MALVRGAIAAQVLLTAVWWVGGLTEGRGYRISAHGISDLGARTADHAGLVLAAQGVAGVVTIVFALFALGPALAAPDGRLPAEAWLVAASPLGLDNVWDVLFRLDCRAADPGCVQSLGTGSWRAAGHLAISFVGFPVLVITPSVLAARFRANPAWQVWSGRALAFSPVMFVGVIAFVGLHGHDGAGYAERALALAASTGVVLLALGTRRALAAPPGPAIR
ncbi:DUF998 domain-containing protein [Streptomyces sp. SP17BM10]|uniref:DUF998 domain-containing protein n=1 Tax=Streptomyces sp. SP17BM10 TaxID=3002530 RepID=UPI002E764617|nr:DUF998 domain-containing protein [Streptomyces sp. SP17BM10]MEE1782433.1 DUF998 domain-containing protein [Streptomyces sp. SP17BM10]